MKTLATLDNQVIEQNDDLSFAFLGMLNIDGDGGRNTYKPDDTGLDSLSDAKTESGAWCGVVTDSNGNPVIDPETGNYISPTSLALIDPTTGQHYPPNDSRRYVDSESVCYAVVPPALAFACAGVVLGCRVTIKHIYTGKEVEAVCADTGNNHNIGEASIAVAREFGVNPSPRNGGDQERNYLYTFYPNTPAEGYTLQPL